MPTRSTTTLARRASTLAIALTALCAAAPPLDAQPGAPAGPVPVERLAARRMALATRIGTGVAVLRAAEERDFDGRDHSQDTWYRQDNDFFYLTGIETPRSWLVIVARGAEPPAVTLYLPPRDTLIERWLGPRLAPGPEAAALTGIDDVRASPDVARDLAALLADSASPARRGAVYRKPDAERGAGSLDSTALRRAGVRVEDLRPHLARLRLVKDADELARLRVAARITAAAHVASWRVARLGAWERELEAEAEASWRRAGAERNGYPSIVGAGRNSTTLHYTENRGRLAEGDLVVMDMGAEWGYYKADVTRTIPAGGRFTPRQRAIYDLVLGAQQEAIDSVRPGAGGDVPIRIAPAREPGTAIVLSREPGGAQSVLAAAIALAGIVATALPRSALAQAVNRVLPQLHGALPAVFAGVATVVAACSRPPRAVAAARRRREGRGRR